MYADLARQPSGVTGMKHFHVHEKKVKKNMKYLQTEAFIVIGNQVFASAMNKNGLYLYDIDSHRTRLLDFFDHDEFYEWRLHCAAAYDDKCVYFFPDRAKGIYKINAQTFEQAYYPLAQDSRAKYSCKCFAAE